MTTIIRQALSERILQSQQALSVLRDFSQVTGLPLRLATPLGVEIPVPGAKDPPPVCQWMQSPTGGRRHLCAALVQRAMEDCHKGTCMMVCPAGLREAAIPLKVGAETIGFLLLGQVADAPVDLHRVNRWRHELERIGQKVAAEELRKLLETVPVQEGVRFDQTIRLAEWLASSLSAVVSKSILEPTEKLPPAVIKACGFLRAHYAESLTLADVARQAGLSREHFCTVFHQSTGLRYTEYLTRVRVDQAARRLRMESDSVTDICFAVGFQSVAHFNRRFKEVMGMSPRDYRKSLTVSPESNCASD